jgi:2,4-dienoyl-CoA reductase-like NADH-dependent reductase (Old Yellow Enzyme family)
MKPLLSTPFALRSGQVLPNRIAKGAMTERLAAADHQPNDRHQRLYSRWAQSGCALLISGNVMIDRRHLEAPGNVVVDGNESLDRFQAWRESARNGSEGGGFWLQLNHPGRQSPAFINPDPVSPSAIAPRDTEYFRRPRELSDSEIRTIPERFARGAELAQASGFDGVQLHACYGYLLSSFLSPRANRRTDSWGGSPENRRRLLLETVRAVREATGREFSLGVKVNCSDYLPGGLTKREAFDTIIALQRTGVDLIDLSGGSQDKSISFATKYRKPLDESLFLPMAKAIKSTAPECPLMITGNLRSGAFMEEILRRGYVDVIGLARPLLVEIEFPHKLCDGFTGRAHEPTHSFGTDLESERVVKEICWYYEQIHRLSVGGDIDLDIDLDGALAAVWERDATQAAALPQAQEA